MALLTVAEFKSLVPGGLALSDAAIQILLDGTEAAITLACGPVGEIVEIRDGGLSYILLGRPIGGIGDIDTITETDAAGNVTSLDAADLEIRGGGTAIRRLVTGPNASSWFVGTVTITYTPTSDIALRKLAQAELVKLEIASNPGLAMQVVGNWTIQFQQGKSYADLRAEILSTLYAPGPVFA